jgi:hypothetical protein
MEWKEDESYARLHKKSKIITTEPDEQEEVTALNCTGYGERRSSNERGPSKSYMLSPSNRLN